MTGYCLKKLLLSPWLRKTLLFGLLLIFTSSASAQIKEDAPQEKPPIFLSQGEQRLIRIHNLQKFSLGSHHVRALPLPHALAKGSLAEKESILLKGIAPGLSDLWVWKGDGTSEHRSIQVVRVSPKDFSSPLLKGLGQLNETEVIITGKSALLRGEICSFGEAARLSALLSSFQPQIQNQTRLCNSLLNEATQRLQKWLRNSSFQSAVRVEKVGSALWLRGHLPKPGDKDSVTQQAKSIFPLVEIDIETLPEHAPIVYFRVFLLELSRSNFSSFGLSWSSQISDSFHVKTGSFSPLSQIDLTLNQLEGNGHVKILSNPELVVRAPGEAELFAGGEIPIQTQSRFLSKVTWKKFGLTLKLKVTHATGEKIRLDIYTEVSHLDHKIGQDQIPGFQSNQMKTQVDAQFGSPLLLSGLLQNGLREEIKGLPFLRNLPVLGKLFGSESYLNEESELVAILYPYVSPPAPLPDHRFKTFPKGQIPPPRNWISPTDEERILGAENYPWNALE